MSSPSVPVVSPTDLDEVVVYNSGGEEFERRRRGSVRDQSLVRGSGSGFSGGSETDQVSSRVAKGEGGVLSDGSGEALSFPALRGGTQQEAAWARVVGGASGVLPLFSCSGRPLGTVVESPRADSFNHGGLPSQAGGGLDDVVGSTGG
ncbi:hypothetical protein J132_06482 [Termitomyces sp. J132]|nr:hypothetical protein J132_06482 [Termitomyces sp. J132]